MGTGYTRNDTANNIADGNVINASDLDGEFDAIQAAFNATTGHSHDGTTGEGPQIGTTGIADNAVTLGTKTTGNYVAAGAVSGVGLSGSASSEGATFTVTSNATSANTASTIVARDASGNFSAGTITANLTGTASNATNAANAALLDSLDSTQFLRSDAADTKTSGDLSFADNVKATFGAGSDLQVFHDGSNSIVKDAGTGILKIQGSGQVTIEDTAGNVGAAFNANTDVALKYAGSNKLVTTSGGIDVTGSVTADGAIIQNSSAAGTQIVIENTSATTSTDYKIVGGKVGVSNEGFSIYDSANATTAYYIDSSGNHEFLGGNVGIGTASPNKILHLETSGETVQRMVASTTNLAGFYFGDSGNGSIGQLIYDNSSDAMRFNTNGAERMRITSTGNVGIGTSSPIAQSKLTVAGGAGSISVTGSDGNFAAGGQRSFIDFAGGKARVGGTGGGSTGTTLGLYVGTGLEAVSVTAAGNVGIGMTPTQRLEVNGGIALQSTQLLRWNNAGTITGSVAADNSNNLLFYNGSANTERMRIDTSGRLGIGTSSPTSPLHVETTSQRVGTFISTGADPQVYVGDAASSDNAFILGYDRADNRGYLTVAGDSDSVFTIANGGNVGIGTSSPTATLDVDGSVVAATHSAGSITGAQTPNFSTYQNFVWTLTGNITLSNPTTEKTGQSGFFIFIHSGAARTVSLGTDFETAGGAGLTLSSTAGAVDIVPYVVQSSGNILLGTPQLAFS